MKAATGLALLAAALAFHGCLGGVLFGFGLAGFQTVSIPVDIVQQVSLPVSTVPLASGLSLQGTTAYTKSSPVPSDQCLTTALSLFTNCQPFLTVLVQDNSTVSKLTILQLLIAAENKTSDAICFNTTLTYLNQGCVCSEEVYNTVQALPTSTVPQLLKESLYVLAKLYCPSGLIGTPSPPPTTATAAAPTTTSSATAAAVAGPTAG